ncbi:MAG TPA: ATP-binding protein [Polyangia bacterium]|nr:ATP-binding protein [Polyangia bacterium]
MARTLPDEIHPRAAALLAAGTPAVVSDAAEPEGAHERSLVVEDAPYPDDAAYLEEQMERLRARVEAAIAAGAGDGVGQERASARAAALGVAIGRRVAATQGAGRPLGLETLRTRFGLGEFETEVLLHAAVPVLEPGLLRLYGRLSGHNWRTGVDVGTVIQVHFEGAAARLRARMHFRPEAPLLSQRLVLLDRGRPESREDLLGCELRLPPRVARVLLGQELPVGARAYARLLQPEVTLDDVVLPPEVQAEVESLASSVPGLEERLRSWGLGRVMPTGRGVTVLLAGPPGTGKSMLAHALAQRLGKRLLAVDAQRLLEAGRTLEDEVEELGAEAQLQDAVLLIDECEALLGTRRAGNRVLGTLLQAFDRFTGVTVLATNLPDQLDPALDRRVLVRIDLEVPPPPLRERIWRRHLPPEVPLGEDVDLAQLAKRYDVSGGYIKNAVLLAVSRALARGGEAQLSREDLEQAAQAQLRGDLSGYAERTRSALSLDVLVLPEDVKAQIVEVIAAGKNRAKVLHVWGFHEKIHSGRGQVVLLSGEPGTGKTLSAEVIAAELGMSLYRINPAKVVSKYVGETEKNLDQILGQAKSLHAILFFDEADALFATRVQRIESANDRFVNLETNFLLQQLERYEGLVILATNLETSIDQAFKRRIHYHVNIPFPDARARTEIWRNLLPERAPLAADVDFVRLGKIYELSGGHIKNAVMRAAYLAAERTVEISMALLMEAAEKECAAAGKLFQSIPTPA